MRSVKFLILIIFFITASSNKAVSQKKIYSFWANTEDDFYWNGTKYLCDVSPLYQLGGYKDVYDGFGDCHHFYGIPKSQDKNYIAFWTIIDDMLLLYDVRKSCAIPESGDDNLDAGYIEKFLNAKFSKDFLPIPARKDERFKNGVIPAVWFTDTLYIKRHPDGKKWYDLDKYNKESFTRLTFDKGRLMEEKQVEYIERLDKSFYPKEKIIIQKSNRNIICLTDSMSISIPFCIDRKNIQRIEDNFDDNNRCITLTLSNKPEMMPLSEVYKDESYKNCIYIIDDEVIAVDPTLFMIEKGIIYKFEAKKPSELKQDITIVKIRTKPGKKEDEFMTSLTF